METTASHSESANEAVARLIALKPAARSRDSGAAELTRRQIEYLRRQGELQDDQSRLLRLQRKLLRRQLRRPQLAPANSRWDSLRRGARLAIECGIAMLLVLLLAIVVAALYGAASARGVVVAAFSVPPALEQQGHGGTAVAAMLVDRLNDLQRATRASAAKRQTVDAWSEEIHLEPGAAQTRFASLQRELRGLLGRQTRLDGSIAVDGDGIEVIVRGDDIPAKTFSGKPAMLDALIGQAAEAIYGRVEPFLFATYLASRGRQSEVVTLISEAYGSAIASDQPLLMNQWGLALTVLGRDEEAIDKFREAVRLRPELWASWNNIISMQIALQREEEALQTGAAMDRAARRGRAFAADVPAILFFNQDQLRWDLGASHAALVADMAGSDGHGTGLIEGAAQDAQILALLHDARAAEHELQTAPGAGKDEFVVAASAFTRGLVALDRDDYAQALVQLRDVDAATQSSPALLSNFNTSPACWVAIAEEWSGNAASADAALERGARLVDCRRFRADISDHRGDFALAQKQYAEAVALAPSSPSAYFSWAQALRRHGDLNAAVARYAEAVAHGPHWADPLAGWGDALAARKDLHGAIEKYERAADYAPNWGALHLRWGRALEQLGNRDRAREHYRRALELDLSPADRKALAASGTAEPSNS